MKDDRAVVVRWHSASFACGAEFWSQLDVQRTSGEAVSCVGPTRLSLRGHSPDENLALQRSPATGSGAIVPSEARETAGAHPDSDSRSSSSHATRATSTRLSL